MSLKRITSEDGDESRWEALAGVKGRNVSRSEGRNDVASDGQMETEIPPQTTVISPA